MIFHEVTCEFIDILKGYNDLFRFQNYSLRIFLIAGFTGEVEHYSKGGHYMVGGGGGGRQNIKLGIW